MNRKYGLKGNICYSQNKDNLITVEQGYLIGEQDKVIGVFADLPAEWKDIPIVDYKEHIILPGLVDLHTHAPQYTYRGLGMDLELLDWLNTHTFPAESKYADVDYAKRAYAKFVSDIRSGATTRLGIFATLHLPATEILMNQLEDSGLVTYVGKVNMDRNCPDYLSEGSPDYAEKLTRQWLALFDGKYKNTYPILTPRFIPTCSDELMRRLEKIRNEADLPVQSHLSENLKEIEWVSQLCPQAKHYGDAYHRFGLFGTDGPVIMAHCVYSEPDEIEMMKQQGVFIAHCPQSNTNLASGIAPARTYLDQGLNMGLGTDMAGGCNASIFRAMADAIQVSKLRWRLVDDQLPPLTAPEAFYLGTKGGGSFFGKVGSFEPEYELDAVIIDDSAIKHFESRTIEERVERIIYLADQCSVVGKYVRGERLF